MVMKAFEAARQSYFLSSGGPLESLEPVAFAAVVVPKLGRGRATAGRSGAREKGSDHAKLRPRGDSRKY
jgi:hypothetical protein